jgi:sugar phosphate permease
MAELDINLTDDRVRSGETKLIQEVTEPTEAEPEFDTEKGKEHDKRRKRWQIGIFSICWFSYMSVHLYREMWSLSKPEIYTDDKYGLTRTQLSNLDTTNFMVYGLT